MSSSHQTQTGIALDHFEKFSIGQFQKSMDIVVKDSLAQKYDNPQKHQQNLYNLLQDFIKYLESIGHDPNTIRTNFNLAKNYLNWYGFEIYSESVKSRLKFPRKVEEEKYPLTVDDVKKIMDNSSESRKALYLFLTSTGCRISESLQLRKRDLDFSFDRIMVRIPGDYTKTKKPRKTFVTKECEEYLRKIIDKIGNDGLIFGTSDKVIKSKHNEEDHFYRMRIRAGLIESYSNGIHKITLHSFRSWFVTKCNRVDSDFGNALAGHQKYMKQYNRFTELELCELFIKAESSLSIFDRANDNQQEEIEQLKADVKELHEKYVIPEQEKRTDFERMKAEIIKELTDSNSKTKDLLDF